MAQIELSSLVGLTQSYIAKNYAAALIDKSKTAELKAYIGKYLYDTGYSVAGYDTKGLVSEAAAYDVNSMFLIHSPFDGLDFLTYPVISLIAVPIYFGVFVICDLCAHKKGERFYNQVKRHENHS